MHKRSKRIIIKMAAGACLALCVGATLLPAGAAYAAEQPWTPNKFDIGSECNYHVNEDGKRITEQSTAEERKGAKIIGMTEEFTSTANDVCLSGDCERSDLEEKDGTNLWFCDCKKDEDCNVAYDPPLDKSSWTCVNGNATQHGVDYCQSTKSHYTIYAVSPRKPNLGQRCLQNSVTCANADCTQVGSPCSSNDCETAKLYDKTTGQQLSFCDCFSDSDCYTAYGAPPNGGGWDCVDGMDATYDLDYCMSTKGDLRYAITPGDPSWRDVLFDPTAAAAIGLSKVAGDLNKQMSIKIPNLVFSKIEEKGGDNRNIAIPWIGEYLAAIYRYAMAAGSVLAVVMIIMQGARIIVSGGGEQKMAGFKRIGQIVAGLFILWGSYAILYNINPDLTIFRPVSIRYLGQMPLDTSDHGEVGSFRPQGLNFAGFDELFKSYGNCLSVDWRVLKALAYVESSFAVEAQSSQGYSGLFQTSKTTCEGDGKGKEGVLTAYGLQDRCANINDPETSAMVGTAMIKNSVEKIKKQCRPIDNDSLLYFIYLGHHAPAALDHVLKSNTCDYTNAQPLVYEFWQTHQGGIYAEGGGKIRNARVIAVNTDSTARKMLALTKQMGIDIIEPAANYNKSLCPLENKGLIGKAPITLPGDIPCDDPQKNGLVKIENSQGVRVTAGDPYLTPATAAALAQAGRLADERGYKLLVKAACRDLETQQKLARQQGDTKAVAKPGKSAHGFGFAVDVALADKNSEKPLINIGDTANQCGKENKDPVAKLSRIMYDAGFFRYAAENWHFEFQSIYKYCRSNNFFEPSPCGADCPL